MCDKKNAMWRGGGGAGTQILRVAMSMYVPKNLEGGKASTSEA